MDNQKVSVHATRKFGRGVFADRFIKKGELIAAFDGPIFDEDYEPWTRDMYNHAIQFGRAIWRDSKGMARLINHSCEPNCGIKALFKVVAMRDINSGEQITWDYEMTEKNLHWKMKCKCGNKNCRGVIGNYSNMPLEVRKKYKGHISEWLTSPSTKAKTKIRPKLIKKSI
ncbi:MAG: SET domain-containing protein-lysine N-methyltransferase [Bdellovibrionaceae bacterium]|nr:SET domain-containing protein-lysine N-methyltransferase [Bdellovibrio sp.]